MSSSKVLFKSLAVILFLIGLTGCASLQDAGNQEPLTVSSKDGSSIAYGVSGEGDTTIVFVHCWTCSNKLWQPQIEHFSKAHKVIWLDLAGHGSSQSNRTKYTMESFSEDVAAVVNKAGVDRVILVGHSMGGPVSVEAARRLGDKVVAIVGVDTFYTGFEYPTSEKEIEGFVAPFKTDFLGTSQGMVQSMFVEGVDPQIKAVVSGHFDGANPEMGISAMYEIFRWSAANVPATLDSYLGKLVNINGAPTGEEKVLHESVRLIPGVGHFVPQVKPMAFNLELEKVIAEYQ